MPESVKNDGYQPITFDAIKIGLASPEKIREWSHGEVLKAGNHQLQNSETRAVTVCSASVSSDPARTGSATAVSTRRSVTKA